ncbi:putative nuclease HARBI1 [Panulirus ornatus]|uniref:putative nuclease HARBI1 n=1 Tax=Panulirus ornatus TaxID=150431 RepID=UPI003A886CF3
MAITPELKVMITLRYLATGKMLLCSGDDFGPTQPTVSRVIAQTLQALSSPEIVRRFIKFPTDVREIQTKQEESMQIAAFSGVVGAIDGTHVRIMAPSVNEEHYVNRKNYHSINTQIVFDAKYKIINIDANWLGSTHDSRTLQQSGLRRLFENHHVPPSCHLIGDSGYPCKRWLLTRYL